MGPGADHAAVYCVGEIVEDIVAVNSSDLDNPKSEILQILLQALMTLAQIQCDV
jgi:NTP pyrophosphatase (non-canonical NTP hydrolase)